LDPIKIDFGGDVIVIEFSKAYPTDFVLGNVSIDEKRINLSTVEHF